MNLPPVPTSHQASHPRPADSPGTPPCIEHLYFHIPFCPKVCPYCCFYVEEGSANRNTAFLEALLREVDQAAQTCALRPRTLYFGGGTPTALRTEQLAFLLEGLRQRLDLSALQEWTVEANPSTVRPEKARLLRQFGVTRVSLGVQSWTDSTLKTLGRTHSAEQARHTFTVLRAEKFPSLNIDLMFSVPGQSHADWERDLAETLALRPDHVSCYCLTYEEDTEFFRKLTSGRFVQNEEKDAALFETTMDRLEAAGFDHYEISNYARPGHCSLHNLAYWQGADFWGFGPSAFSTRGTQRTQNVCNTTEYVRRLHADLSPTASVETLPESTRARERILFGLRMRSGVERLQLDPWAGEVQHLLKIGLLEDAGTRIRLTRRGRLLADLVGESFVDAPLP